MRGSSRGWPGLPVRRPGHPYLAGAPLFIAHRGGAALAPENTMAAFTAAVERWDADVLEMDVHGTADGRVVVIHDATVDRTCDGSGAVRDLPWSEVRSLDAGHRFRDLTGEHAFRGRGVGIPLLDEVLESFPATRMNVEAKTPGVAPLLVETIRRHAAQNRVLMAAELEGARPSRHGYPGPHGASRRQIRLFYLLHQRPLGFLYSPRADALQVPDAWMGRRVVTPRFVREAHRRNIPVHVWTIDETADMRRLLSWGVDGIQSDRLDRLARVLVEETGRPPPPALIAASAVTAVTTSEVPP